MIKIFYTWGYNKTREYRLIKQGLENNTRIKLVDNEQDSDFVFQLAYHHKRRYPEMKTMPPGKTVIIDYNDNPSWIFRYEGEKYKGWKTEILAGQYQHKGLAYFKRAWVDTEKKPIEWPEKFHPITFAIMDEFILEEDLRRTLTLSCSLRTESRNLNRKKVVELLNEIKEFLPRQEGFHIGRFNKGAMDGFNDVNMRGYFNLLKHSQIVVTCNPDKWEGDHRTWEALASGALVFVDGMHTPLTHPLIGGIHCVFYDTTDKGLEKLKEKILWYLGKPLHASKIADAGHAFAMRYHRASSRIDEILGVIT